MIIDNRYSSLLILTVRMASLSILKSLTRKISGLSLRSDSEARELDIKVRDSILAFSTTSTMLAYINHRRTFNDRNRLSLDNGQRRALYKLNTLATILAKQHEVVAVCRKIDDKEVIQVTCRFGNY